MAEAMARKGWMRVPFGDVVRQVRDRIDPEQSGLERYVAGEHMDSNDLRIRRWGHIGDGYLGPAFHMRFKPGHVLYGSRRTYLRKIAVADFEGVTANTTFVIESRDPKILLPELLPWIMQTEDFHAHSISESKGSVNPYINFSDLTWYEFALPPLGEQPRIAQLLAASQRTLEALRSMQERLETCERSYLIDAFGSTPGESSSGLTVALLSDLAEIQTGLAKGRRPDASTTTLPYLRVANVKDGGLDLTEVKMIVVARDKVARYSLRCGDVLMTEGGDLDKLGRGTVWQDEIPGCLHQNHIFVVRTQRRRLDPWYLAAVARSRYGRAYFLSCAKRTSNLASVNKSQLGQFPIPLMEPSTQQEWLMVYQDIRTGISGLGTRLAEMTAAHRTLVGQLMERAR